MKRALVYALVLCVAVGIWNWRANQNDWRARMENSPMLTLYSLDPHKGMGAPDAARIKGYRVLGQTTLRGADSKTALNSARVAADADDSNQSTCIFAPRVALQSEDRQTLLLLCFSCGEGETEVQGARKFFAIRSRTETEGKASEDQLNDLLRRAHVPLSPLDEWEKPTGSH